MLSICEDQPEKLTIIPCQPIHETPVERNLARALGFTQSLKPHIENSNNILPTIEKVLKIIRISVLT